MTFDTRLRAICALNVPAARADAGRHEYDGVVQDLSPEGVRRGLAALGGPCYADPHDEAHARAAEHALRVRFGELELHRVQPSWHLRNLDPGVYDRAYAPSAEREQARRAHVRAWPEAVEAAISALDRVPVPLAEVAIADARNLSGYAVDDPAATAALERLIAHLETATEPSAAMGPTALHDLMSASEAVRVDLDELAGRADAERALWHSRLAEVGLCVEDPPEPDEVVPLAASLVHETREWARDYIPYTDGEVLVGPTPPGQTWQVAMMTPTSPYEPEGPSWYRVTPPDPSWPVDQQKQWLSLYQPSALANITLHEVSPGHFAHARARRHAVGGVRKTLASDGFIEGWAHYAEQLALEEGFRKGDRHFEAVVARDALLRLTRLACTIGLHMGTMSLAEAAHRYETDAFLAPHNAVAAVHRILRDHTTVSYTWGKWSILDLRERARAIWGPEFSLPRFHRVILALGSPPLGLLDTALEHSDRAGMAGQGPMAGARNARAAGDYAAWVGRTRR